MREKGTEAAVRTLEVGDYWAARIHLDITFDRVKKEVEEMKKEKGLSVQQMTHKPAHDSSVKKTQTGPEL